MKRSWRSPARLGTPLFYRWPPAWTVALLPGPANSNAFSGPRRISEIRITSARCVPPDRRGHLDQRGEILGAEAGLLPIWTGLQIGRMYPGCGPKRASCPIHYP